MAGCEHIQQGAFLRIGRALSAEAWVVYIYPLTVCFFSASMTLKFLNGMADDLIPVGTMTTSFNHEPQVSKVPASTRLRHLLDTPDHLIACPGVYDGFSARIALEVGFDALYMTGAGTTASRLGHADLGIAQLADMRGHAEMIANLDRSVPLIADMDTGYGAPIMVARSVQEYVRANVAGFHIEDQIMAKRCGHLQGKEVVDIMTYEARIRAARIALDRLGSDCVLIGRTDALQKHGYAEAVKRLKAARDAGADVGQLEGITSREMGRNAVKDLHPFPLLLNMVGALTYRLSMIEPYSDADSLGRTRRHPNYNRKRSPRNGISNHDLLVRITGTRLHRHQEDTGEGQAGRRHRDPRRPDPQAVVRCSWHAGKCRAR